MIKDTCYAAYFDKKDLPYLYKLAEKVRNTHDQSLVDDFNLKCEQKYNDHNPILGDNIQFLDLAKADDLVVTAGINLCIDQILGTSVVRWRWMMATNGSTTPTAADTSFTGIGTGVDMSLSGWREYASSSLRFAAIYGETLGSSATSEAAIMTGNGTGTLLCRNIFTNYSLSHTVNTSGYVISTIIEFVPMM